MLSSGLGVEPVKRSVLVVDDHPLFRAGLRQLIQDSPDMVVAAVAGTVQDALAAARALDHLDAVVTDLSLPDGHGLTLVPQLLALHPAAKVLVLSMHDELLFADRCLQAGAHGYVSKTEPPEAILAALRRIWAGRLAVGERVVELALQRLAGPGTSAGDVGAPRLSNREEEVLDLVGQGLTTRVIAERLHISVKTVETHLARLREKLGARNKLELTRMAYGRRLSDG